MNKFLPLLAIFLIHEIILRPIQFSKSRKLAGYDTMEEEEDFRKNAIEAANDSSLNPESTALRVESLIGSVDSMRNKCSKFLFVLKNYLSFYENRSADKLLEQMNVKKPGTSFIPQHLLSKYPSLSSITNEGTNVTPPGSQRRSRGRNLRSKLGTTQFRQPKLYRFGDIDEGERNFNRLE